VSGLSPGSRYRIVVYSVNGVSDVSGVTQSADVVVTTQPPGESLTSSTHYCSTGGSVAEWFACRTRVQIAAATLSGNSLGQTVHAHRASVHQPSKLAVALLRVARVTAGLAESSGSLPSGL